MDRGVWWATVPEVARVWNTTQETQRLESNSVAKQLNQSISGWCFSFFFFLLLTQSRTQRDNKGPLAKGGRRVFSLSSLMRCTQLPVLGAEASLAVGSPAL